MFFGKLSRGLLALAAIGLSVGFVSAPASAKIKWSCTHFVPQTSGFYK